MPVITLHDRADVKVPRSSFKPPVLIVIGITFFISISLAVSHGQTAPPAAPSVKITSPKNGDTVSVSGNLTITGTSSDNSTIGCQVSHC